MDNRLYCESKCTVLTIDIRATVQSDSLINTLVSKFRVPKLRIQRYSYIKKKNKGLILKVSYFFNNNKIEKQHVDIFMIRYS